MKAHKLISLLQKFNPDADVFLHDPNGDKVLLVLSGDDTPNSIWLAGEADFDVANEIDARCEAASLENWDEPDFYSELLDDGFDYALMEKYKGKDWADNFLENAKHFGLIDGEQEDIE